MVVLAHPGDAVDEGVDDPTHRGVGRGSVLERADPDHEPVVENIRLELEASACTDGASVAAARASSSIRSTGRSRREPRPPSTSAMTPAPRRPAGTVRESCPSSPVVWRSDRQQSVQRRLEARPRLRLRSRLCGIRADLSTEPSEGVAVIHVAGDFDLSTVATFDAELDRSLSADLVVIELAECTFIDSSALRALVRAQRSSPKPAGGWCSSRRPNLRDACSKSPPSTGSSRSWRPLLKLSPQSPEARSPAALSSAISTLG